MAFWPAAARRLWPAVLFVATIALVAVPLSITSGETPAHTVGENELIEAHEEQGEQVLPFVIVLWLAALGHVASQNRTIRHGSGGSPTGMPHISALSKPQPASSPPAIAACRLAKLGIMGAHATHPVAANVGVRAYVHRIRVRDGDEHDHDRRAGRSPGPYKSHP
ncbi:hypothetical protein [Nonomuraea sp. NPDC049758]|uniref:hypothetical protein n=1 Tax=Nonomuraea sp. NPDC049758 TaxID=3154360 RepID=UPI003430E06A